jgi:POT family proton-dependent oligopeptide transporter
MAGLGMLVGLIQYVLGYKHLGTAGLHPASTGDPARDRKQRNNALLAVGVVIAAVALLAILSAAGIVPITATEVGDALGWFELAIAIVVFSWLLGGKGWSAEERKRSAAVLVLFVASSLFWASFEQAGSTLNLFAMRNTNRALPFPKPFNLFPATWFQSVQPVFVVSLSPVFAWIWLSLARRKKEPPSPAKFALGLLFAGLAFLLLVPPASRIAYGEQAALWWLFGTYLLQTLGELCLSPIGMSATSKLAPDRAAGFMMGIWFLSIAIGNWLAGNAVSVAAKMSTPTLFSAVAGFSIAAAAGLALLIRPTVRLMSGVK